MKPFSDAKTVIDLYNESVKDNSLTQEHWNDILSICDDSLSDYLTKIKGQEATLTGYNTSLQGNITGFRKVYKAIGGYNKLSGSNSEKQKEYCEAINLTNSKLGSYLTNLNGSKAGMLGYASSLVGATLKTVALQVATTALNVAITMGASLIVGGIITAISNWIRQDEILAEKAETAKQKIDELNNNYKEHSQLVSDSAKRYAELAQGVDQLSGKNLSLNDDDYKEFLDLSNQLAEAFPTLSRHYDENGNAILQLSGNVDTIVGSLNNLIEAERALKNQEIADELPTVYKNANNKSDDYKKQIDELKEQRQTLIDSLGDVQSDDFSKNFIDGLERSMISVEGENLETLSKMKDDYLKILKDANIDYEELTPDYENKDGVDIPVRFNIKINSSEEDIKKAKKTIKANVENLASEYEGDISELNDKIQSVQDKNKANWSSLTGSIAAWLDTEDSYKIMSDDMQSTIQNIVNSLDWGELDFSSWEDAKQYIQDNILSLFQTSDGKDILKKIEVMFGIQTQFNNGEITVNEYQEKLKTFLDEISTLAPDTQKAIKLIFGISTDEDGTTTSSVDTMVNNVKSKLKDEFDDKVGELSLDDLQVASKLEIPEGTLLSWDELKQKIEETKNAVSNDTFSIPDAETLKQQISDLNSAIDSIQSAYDTLNSAVEEYNSNGGQLSIDTIQSLLSLSDEYLACLQVENGQLSLNADAMAQLAQAKLDDAQATAVTQAMTELNAIANGEAAQSTTNYITGNAALMDSLAKLSGSYDGVAQAAMTAAQAQELSARISAASAKDKTATENVMKGLDNKLKLIQATKTTISAGNFAKVVKKSSSSKSGSSSKDELKEAFQAEYDLLKHNLDMEYITEEQYYNGVQALNEKYFAGKEEYLDDYRKYEEEVYKGLKSYYKSYCDDMMDYYDKKLDASKMSYKEYCDSVSKMLADMHNSGKISDKDWYDYTKTMLEKQKDAYDRALSAITRRLQKEIDAWQAKIDALNDQNDALNEQKDNYDKILSAVSNVYNKEIDRLNEQKDLLQDQIDALNDKNDALDLQYRKEQALYALQKAQQQRTRKLYVEGKGYIYDTDNEAIRDAQKDLSDIKNEELINSLQKEQDKIQESIDILEKYKEKWNEIPDAWDKAISEQLAIELWGQEYEKLILLNRTSDIENFKNKYLKIQSQINDNEELIKSYEEKVDYYTKLKEQWSSLSDEYSNSVDDMYAKMLLGQSWEADVLNGRLSTLNNFRNQYNDIQKAISDMAWQSANAQISALNAVKAAEATKAQTYGGSNGYSGSSGTTTSVGGNTSGGSGLTAAQKYQVRLAGTVKVIYEGSSETDLRNWITRNNYIGVSRTIQNNIIIYFAKKKEKKYIGQVYKTSGQASSQVGMLGGVGYDKVSGGYQVYKYAKGTNNAKKGLHIVSEHELGDEIIIKNDNTAVVPHGEQFYNFEGGETVIPADETKEILKNQGNVEQLSDSDVITRKDGSILKPIHYEYENILTNFIKDNPDYMYSMNNISDNLCKDLFKNTENVNYDNRNVDNRVSIGEIHLHKVQDVDQFARELDRQLAGIVDQKLSRRKR